jgi:hypothetical protein
MQTLTATPKSVIRLLQLEGLVMFIVTLAVYYHLRLDGWLFAILLLSPDLAMIGYLRSPEFGAWTYNLAHNYALAVAFTALAFFGNWTLGLALGLIWIAHISMDRAVGYGLKYPTSFGDTHLGKKGK